MASRLRALPSASSPTRDRSDGELRRSAVGRDERDDADAVVVELIELRSGNQSSSMPAPPTLRSRNCSRTLPRRRNATRARRGLTPSPCVPVTRDLRRIVILQDQIEDRLTDEARREASPPALGDEFELSLADRTPQSGGLQSSCWSSANWLSKCRSRRVRALSAAGTRHLLRKQSQLLGGLPLLPRDRGRGRHAVSGGDRLRATTTGRRTRRGAASHAQGVRSQSPSCRARALLPRR
jgi:hypothetical protein